MDCRWIDRRLAGRKGLERGRVWIGDIVVGVLGGLLGGYLATNLFHIKQAVTGINVETILVALIGAVLLLAGLRLLNGSSRQRSIFR